MKLTKNFCLAEFLSTRKKVPLNPTSRHLHNIIDLAQNQMQPIRDLFSKPIIITSGYRNKELNFMVGGTKTSDHLAGKACDFYISKEKRKEIVWDAAQILTFINFGKLIIYIGQDRFHISSGDSRKIYLKFNGITAYQDITEYLRVIK